MYFDFDDHRPETPTIEGAISRREGILLSITIHAVLYATLVTLPRLPVFQEWAASRAAQQAEIARQIEEERRQGSRFVFVQPRLEMEAPRPPAPQAEASDRDRVAMAPERAPNPANRQPFSRGNTSERVDVETLARSRPGGEAPEGRPGARGTEANESDRVAEAGEGLQTASPPSAAREGRQAGTAPSGSALGDALRNIERYVTPEVFQNLRGGAGEYGPFIQFDTKGVEFGPWIRRFIAQIRRNWFVPYAAYTMKGHVVITFFVHRDGAISDLAVVGPSTVESFTHAAYNALLWSNPTQPLPPEYPDDRAYFTVTFFYNETPPEQ